MTRAELLRKYERLADGLVPGTLAPVADVYRQFSRELLELEAAGEGPSYVDTERAALMLGVSPKTVANWCTARRFEYARKTGEGRGGKWVIPVRAIREYLGLTENREALV